MFTCFKDITNFIIGSKVTDISNTYGQTWKMSKTSPRLCQISRTWLNLSTKYSVFVVDLICCYNFAVFWGKVLGNAGQ